MERLSFTSTEALEAYCEHLRADLTSRTTEQRQLIETALARLDQLATQAEAVHSQELAAEILARREEGLQMLARLGAVPPFSNGAPVAPALSLEELSVATVKDDVRIDSPADYPIGEPESVSAENGFNGLSGVAINGDSPAATSEIPVAGPTPTEEVPEITFEPPAPSMAIPTEPEEVADISSMAADKSNVEAMWQQAVEPLREPVVGAFEAPAWIPPEVEPEIPAPVTAEVVVDTDPSVDFPTFEAPPVEQPGSQASNFDTFATTEPDPEPLPFSPVAEAPAVSQPTPPPKATDLPGALNWAWGGENDSPAWAELLVADAPVPMEPLTDSHFVHAPPASEIAAASDTDEAPTPVVPPAALASNDAGGIQQLILSVKVGEWGSDHPLSKPELLIGRRDLASRCMPDVEVLYDQAVSRRHLRIIQDNGGYVVEDLESTNGTTLNGHSLRPGQRETLKLGDELEIGEFTLLKIAAA